MNQQNHTVTLSIQGCVTTCDMEEEAEELGVPVIGRGVGVEWIETEIFETGLNFLKFCRPLI